MNTVYFGLSAFVWAMMAVAVLGLLWLVATFNGLVRLRNRVDEAWSDIEVQLKRRMDLIPNLVETVKGYAGHEKKVFEEVTAARTRVMSAEKTGDVKKLRAADSALANTLKTLFAVAENYPDLKANANFLDLQRELADTENKIQAARRFYNSNVMELNTKIDSFPSNLVASVFKFSKREFFDIPDEAGREPVKVSF